MYLLLDRLMEYLVDHLMEIPIYLPMDHLTEHLMGHLMDHLVDHLMVQPMEFPMDFLMDCSTYKTINCMGMGINNPLTLLTMALWHLIIKVLHITMLPCSPSWVIWEEVIIPLAKAMVCIEINLI